MREVKALRTLPWFLLALLLAGGLTLWLLFVSEQKSHLNLGFETQVERLVDELMRSRLEGRLGAEDPLPEGVEAFALYNPRGDRSEAWGEGTPARLDASPGSDLGRRRIVTAWNGEWLDFIKTLEPLRPRMFLGSDDRPGSPPPGRRQGYAFLRVSNDPLEDRLWAWNLGGALGAAAWSGFVAFVGFLWWRTRRYQAALQHHRELLQYAEASRTLGHELQNPLAAILLQTALLKRAAPEGPAPEVLVIEEEARRMSALVSRVRDFLKDPRGQAEAIDLAGVAEALADRFATPLTITVDGPRPLSVLFDPHRLRSVVENLVKNAVEAGSAPEAGPEIRLSRPRSGWVRCEVLDSGPGFTPEALKKALDPFFTTKTSGTGIGLAIADSFVRAAGGRLRLENRPEGGARVTVDLPEVPL